MDPDPAAAFNALLGERWPFMRDRIVTHAGGTEALALDGTATDVPRAFDAFARARPGEDARGLASLWIQWYAVTVWPPLVAGMLTLWRAPALTGGGTALLLDAAHQPSGLRVPPRMAEVEPGAGLEALARVQAAPLVAQVSGRAGMAPRVAWSNLGNVLDWTLDELGAILDGDARDPGYAVLRRRCWGDGTANPLFAGDHCSAARERPARRVCCLRYRLAGFGYCGDCPIPHHRRAPPDDSPPAMPSSGSASEA